MDIDKQKFKYKCPKHPDFKIEFLQIDNLSPNQNNKNLLYCSACVESDSTFKFQDFYFIQNIIKFGTDQILSKWPPVNDDQLLNQLISITKGNEETEQILSQIDSYFSDLKVEILKQIDICKKQMIKEAEQLEQNKTQILSRYQELTKVHELRSILLNNDHDINEKERQSRILVQKIISEKQTITKQLAYLLNEYKKEHTIFNTKSSLQAKKSILECIKSINFFEDANKPIDKQDKNVIKFDVQLAKTDYENCKDCQDIAKNMDNQHYVMISKQKDWQNTVSNIVLEKDKKYIFRIEIQQLEDGQGCMIGLMNDININTQPGYHELMSLYLQYKDYSFSKYPNSNWGINNIVKGNKFELSQDNVIEMRVSIQDSILQLLDYPNYQSQIVLNKKQQYKLKKENLRLYLGMAYQNNKIILKEAFTVDQFD